MPKRGTPNLTTPWARVLWNFMWDQRPPWHYPSELAYHIGYGKQTVYQWLFQASVPHLEQMLPVLARLGIPLSRLLDEYAADGVPLPPLVAPTHVPRAYPPPPATPTDPWQEMIEETERTMREAGVSEPAIAAVVDHIRAKQAGVPQLARHIRQEHVVDADQPTRPIEQMPTQPPARTRPAPTRGGGSSRAQRRQGHPQSPRQSPQPSTDS